LQLNFTDSAPAFEQPCAPPLTFAQDPASVRSNAPDERARYATPLNALLS